MDSNGIRTFVTSLLPEGVQHFLNAGGWWLLLAGLALVGLLLVLGLLSWLGKQLFGRRVPDTESKLIELLAGYPPAPVGAGRVSVEGIPVRLRLVVLAPVGRETVMNEKSAAIVLDNLVRGLGNVVNEDLPKLRIWPPQLSHQGFPIQFHRLVKMPQMEGTPSPWILVAGSTPAGRKSVLVGLAFQADEAVTVGRLTIKPTEWAETIKVAR